MSRRAGTPTAKKVTQLVNVEEHVEGFRQVREAHRRGVRPFVRQADARDGACGRGPCHRCMQPCAGHHKGGGAGRSSGGDERHRHRRMRSDHRSRGAVSVSTAYRSIQKARVGFHTRFIFIPFYCPQPGPGCTAAAYSYKTCPANTQTTRFRSGCSAINWCAAVSTAPALG